MGIILHILVIMGITPGGFLLIFTIIVLLIYQVAFYRYFWGKGKGHYEYYYREFLVDQAAKSLISDFTNFTLDHTGEYFSYLLSYPNVKTDPNLKFIAYYELSRLALKTFDYDKEVEYLREAASLKPADLVANYRLANALERVNDAQAAINAYQAALNDPLLDTMELKELISAQIKRVKTQGPAKKPPIPGFRYFI